MRWRTANNNARRQRRKHEAALREAKAVMRQAVAEFFDGVARAFRDLFGRGHG